MTLLLLSCQPIEAVDTLDATTVATAALVESPTSEPISEEPVNPTVEPTVEPTPTPLPDAGIEPVLGEGAVPHGAIARLGIGEIHSVMLSPGETMLAIGTAVGVYVYRVDALELLWAAATRSPVADIVWSPDGDLLGATLSEGYTYKYLVWDAADGNLLYRGEQADSIVGSFYDALHKYDPLLAHQERDGTILLTNRETGVIIHRLIPDPSVKGWLSLSSFSPDGRFLAKYTGVPHSDAPRTDRRVFVWDIRTGEQVFVFDTGTYVNVVNDVSWSPDGTRLASGLGSLGGGGRPGEVGIWDMSTGTLAQPAIGFSYSVQSVAWSPDGKLIAVGSGGYTNGGELTLLDATSGEQTATWNEHRRPVLHLAWSSDSKLLVAASQDLLTVWDIEAGAPQHVLHAVVEPESMAFSPDASQLAVVLVGEEGQAAIVWDSGSGKTLNAPVVMSTYEDWFDLSSCPENQITAGLDPGSVYSCEGGLRADVVSERGRGYLPAEINVWNRNSERFHLSLTQEGTQLFSMSFSPDEAWLAIGLGAERCHGCYRVTSIDENYVLLWNMLDTTAQLTLYGHTGQVNNLAWAPDGSMLASSSEDGTILIWPVSP